MKLNIDVRKVLTWLKYLLVAILAANGHETLDLITAV
jgi:hypothetical protein